MAVSSGCCKGCRRWGRFKKNLRSLIGRRQAGKGIASVSEDVQVPAYLSYMAFWGGKFQVHPLLAGSLEQFIGALQGILGLQELGASGSLDEIKPVVGIIQDQGFLLINGPSRVSRRKCLGL
jgi:hypothetical protein